MRVLITGANGQVGRELQATCPAEIDLTPCDRADLDITQGDQIRRVLAQARPEVIINAAAYTAVDRAEQERDLAFAVNAEGALKLARGAIEAGARLIHLSTDFVFSGHRGRPYRPETATDPRCVYGASKLAGEEQILRVSKTAGMVIRTAWVYSRFGSNFVKTMLRLMSEREEISVVMDQVGTPTWAQGLARLIWACRIRPDLHGIYHWTDAGVASWYDFAIAIQEEAQGLRLLQASNRVLPVTTADFPAAARRPPYSVLDTTGTRQGLRIDGVHWRRQLRAMLQEMQEYGED